MINYQTALRTACTDLGAVSALLGFESYPGINPLLKTITSLIAGRSSARSELARASEAALAEEAHVAKRMSETLADVYLTILGDDKPDTEGTAIEKVLKAAKVLRMEIDLYRASGAAQPAAIDTDAERALTETITQRDYMVEVGTKLAEKVGEYLGVEVGEWSSANDPIVSAIEALDEADPIDEGASKREVCRCGYDMETSCNTLDPTCKPSAPSVAQDERGAFEAWLPSIDSNPNFSRHVVEGYDDWDAERAWAGWQARAASTTPANVAMLCDGETTPWRVVNDPQAGRGLAFHRPFVLQRQESGCPKCYCPDGRLKRWKSETEAQRVCNRLNSALPSASANVARGGVVPEEAIASGWKALPPKLTPDMKAAIVAAAREYMDRTCGNSPDAMYEAAFAAAPQPASGQQESAIDLAAALEQQRALAIVAAVRAQGFAKSNSDLPTQAESVFDLACEEIEHRLRTEVWTLNGTATPLLGEQQAASGLSDDELDLFRETVDQFDDCGETTTDHRTLMKWANDGLLECEHFMVTAAGNALLAAKGDGHADK